MRKNYIFQNLTKTAMQFVALLLITLMAANSLFAEEVTFVFASAGFSNGQLLPDGESYVTSYRYGDVYVYTP